VPEPESSEDSAAAFSAGGDTAFSVFDGAHPANTEIIKQRTTIKQTFANLRFIVKPPRFLIHIYGISIAICL
jgi:hypothetical protein